MMVNLESNFYPKNLKKIADRPKKLYVEGEIKNLNTNCLAIVGSRNCTEYGKKWCKIFVEELIQYDLTIVSGMATGIDAIAHHTALQNGGKTIAVLPCGFENIYPRENIGLYQKIIENGGTVITEYSAKEKADSNKFLERNRIVSGLSIATLVVEAALRSGTSVTAKFAKSQDRDVFCIPGSLDNPKSVGTNKLIKDFAKIVTEPKDIIRNYPFLHRVEKRKKEWKQKEEQNEIPKEYQEIYKNITETPIDINNIVKLSHRSLKEVMAKLTILELEGKIQKISGNRYKRG